jgi:hypothetical protein
VFILPNISRQSRSFVVLAGRTSVAMVRFGRRIMKGGLSNGDVHNFCPTKSSAIRNLEANQMERLVLLFPSEDGHQFHQ